MADDASVQQSQINNSSIPLGNYIGDIGGTEPLIIINGFQFARNAISHCEISTFSWLPECSLVLHCFDNVFLTQNFPKDGDLVNIFIRSFTDNFNPIRNDYLIIQVSSNSTVDGEGRYGITIYIHGVLFIPKLFAEDCYSLSQMTSFQAMAEIAKNLKLGYVSNETATVDTMTWINAFDTNENFIRKIVSHSYKDQDSFYDYWIDFFYNLNFQYRNKVWGIYKEEYHEIWWYYPSGTNTECSDVIIYNIDGQFWFDTAHARSAGTTSGLYQYPLETDSV